MAMNSPTPAPLSEEQYHAARKYISSVNDGRKVVVRGEDARFVSVDTATIAVARLLQTIAARDVTIGELKAKCAAIERERDAYASDKYALIAKSVDDESESLRANAGEPVGRDELYSTIFDNIDGDLLRNGNASFVCKAIITKFAGRRISHE